MNDLRSRAEAIRIWAKNANQSLEVQNRAAALRLAAERKAGKLLAQATLRGGDRKSNNHRDRLILKDLGISQNQSTRWQKQAAIPDEQFEKYLSGSTLVEKEITAAGLLRMANCVDREQKPKGRKKIPQATNKVKVTGLSSTGINYEAGDLREALNHVSTLRQVFSPFANRETETLSQIEKNPRIDSLQWLEVRTLAGWLSCQLARCSLQVAGSRHVRHPGTHLSDYLKLTQFGSTVQSSFTTDMQPRAR